MTIQDDGHDHPPTAQCNEHSSKRRIGSKVSYKIMPGFRINSKILFSPKEQQFYRFNTTTSGRNRSYVCRESECKCRVHIHNNECYISNAIAHNHERKMGVYYNLCALNEMKCILDSADNESSAMQVFDDVIER